MNDLRPHLYVECKQPHIFERPEHCEECELDPDNEIHALPETAPSTPLPAVAGFFLAILTIILACSGQAQTTPLQHGHISSFNQTHAFLAIKVENLPPAEERERLPQRIDYIQYVDYLVADGFTLPTGAALHRTVYTFSADADGFLLLKLSKPCSPGEKETDVGVVLVCPPSDGEVLAACADPSRGIQPLFHGVPEEIVPCPNQRRRAVRK